MRILCKTLVAALLLAGGALALRAERVDAIQAIVGDSIITFQQVLEIAGPQDLYLRRYYAERPDRYQREASLLYNDSLEALVRRRLILQDFEKSGFNLPESIVDEIVQERIKAKYADRVQFRKDLERQGQTQESFRKDIKEQIIESEMRRKYVPDPVISPHRIELFYQENMGRFKVEDQVNLRMIVLNRPPGDRSGTARRMAEEILSQLRDGAAFAQMAELYSEGSLRKEGGLTGWEDVSAIDNKPLAAAMKKLEPGKFSDVIETPEACFLIYLEGRRPAHDRPLNEVRATIEKELRDRERARLGDQWIRRLKNKTFVRYFQ